MVKFSPFAALTVLTVTVPAVAPPKFTVFALFHAIGAIVTSDADQLFVADASQVPAPPSVVSFPTQK